MDDFHTFMRGVELLRDRRFCSCAQYRRHRMTELIEEAISAVIGVTISAGLIFAVVKTIN